MGDPGVRESETTSKGINETTIVGHSLTTSNTMLVLVLYYAKQYSILQQKVDNVEQINTT